MEKRTALKTYKTAISGIDYLTPSALEIISSLSSYDYVDIKGKEELKEVLNHCDIFWFRLNHKLTRDILQNVKCKYILCAVTGLDHIDLKACEDFKISVISLKGEVEFLKEVRATAEHSINLLLTIVRKSKNAYKHVENGNWDRTQFQGYELYKKKIGILGYGRLGEIVANYAEALGMKVFFYDIENVDAKKSHKRCSSINTLFNEIDVLSIHLPYDEDTHFLVNDSNLRYLKPPVFIVNTSRGGVINEDDLLKRLQEDKIAGYATDVLYGEPQISNHPLVKYAKENENVVISPHIGGNTYESIEKTELFIAQKLQNILG